MRKALLKRVGQRVKEEEGGKRVNNKEGKKYKEMKVPYRSEKQCSTRGGTEENGIIREKGKVGQKKIMNTIEQE